MKSIGLLIAVLGLVSGAVYAMGGFSGLTKRFQPVRLKAKRTENKHPKNKVRRSYTYGDAEREK